jgi:non-ribosomal peptide synthetase component F
MSLQLQFDETVIGFRLNELFLHQLEAALRSLCTPSLQKLLPSKVNTCSVHDLKCLAIWNDIAVSPATESVMSTIAKRAQGHPDSLTLDAWYGSLTYGELEAYAKRIGVRLIAKIGLKKGDRVVVCSEKSLWPFLGVLILLCHS